MKYSITGIVSRDKHKFEFFFSNGVNKEKAYVYSLPTNNWCLYQPSGKSIKFYENVNNLINDFEKGLNG